MSLLKEAVERMAIGAGHVHKAETVRRWQRQFVPPSELHPDLATRADTALLDQLFYATVDECHECRSALLDRVAGDVWSTRKLIDWACFITSETYCGLPVELVDEDASADTVFRPSLTFRRLAAEYHNSGPANAIYDACTAAERREAADTAVVLVDGLQAWGADFLYQ
ncbi:hypothetical protein IPZ58_31160 [Streptomyces roseoverticillatus]|uniref:hypothetical protein n=1 Tax=Streptomyces roseoverticillatus TaxID=66429 RepID=UPI001F3CD3C0|nr:hypothetical protein [Streptomyces roseoverticillatus]MCF3106000.1 hypothetical protein [Streptomyces roseoverticillatus]